MNNGHQEKQKTENKLVSIIIVNWNGLSHLKQCLLAVFKQSYQNYEVILVDNGSVDESVSWILTHYPQVRLIKQQVNLGFATANNIGIKSAQGEYIVTLNNDTKPEPTWLTELVKGLVAPDVGMVASKMLVWDNPTIMDSAGINVDIAGFAWNQGWKQEAVMWNKSHEVFGPCAGAGLYRREMLDAIGLFDEEFFAYYEDVDLAWRARQTGWRCWYMSTAQVLHRHSATGERFNQYKIFLLNRNKIWTTIKNYEFSRLWWLSPLIILLDGASAIYQIWQTRSLLPLKARWVAFVGLRRMWQKRQTGQFVQLAPIRWQI